MAPAAASARTPVSHRTGDTTCIATSWRSSSASVTSDPVTFSAMGTVGARSSMRASTSRIGPTAGRISSLWNAPATFRRTARIFLSFARASARSTAAMFPLITTCTGEFWFATTSCSPPRTSSQRASASRVPTPRRALIVPGRVALASCIAAPRATTSSRAVVRSSTPAATSAANSPSECPATPSRGAPAPPSPHATSTRKAATSHASSAGCTNSVVARAASSWQPATRSRPIAAEASSITAFEAGCVIHASAMPANCDPCPGNTTANDIRTPPPGRHRSLSSRSGLVTGTWFRGREVASGECTPVR